MPGKKTQPWKACPFGGDVDPLARLYEVVNDRPFDSKYWKWLFQDNPAGKGDICLADHDGTIAGQYATVPAKMQINGKPVLAAQSLHTMTHPDYRKQGIFIKLAEETYEALGKKGVNLVYGFPNDSSFHGFTKYLDFFVLEDLSMITRPLKLDEMLLPMVKNRRLSKIIGVAGQFFFDRFCSALRRPSTHGARIKVEPSPTFPKEIDQLVASQVSSFPNTIIRSHAYLTWRYECHPTHSYGIYLGYRDGKLAGYCVCGSTRRKGMALGLIMEIFADPADEVLIDFLLEEAMCGMRLKQMAAASCVLTSKSPFLGMFKKHGFLFSLRSFPYILRVDSRDRIDSSALEDIEGWHITFGDADFV